MVPPELSDLYGELVTSKLGFIPRGEHHMQEILREVQSRFPLLCDDKFL